MSYPGTRSASEAALHNLTENELAAWRRSEGKRVVQRRGRWWEEAKPAFYQAIHWMARHRQNEVERPTTFCWGFRTTLQGEDADAANGWLPAHVLSDVAGYDVDALPRKRRNKLRKCWKLTEIVQVTEPMLLRDQGYEVRCSVAERLKIWAPPSREKYSSSLDDYVGNPHRLVLAGLRRDGKLGGYLDGFAVDGTGYIDHVYLDSVALSTEVGTGLVFEFVQACRRSGQVREVVYGLDVPSNTSLKEFKVKMGFPVVRAPASIWLLPPAGALIRWRRPEVYYRLTGLMPV